MSRVTGRLRELVLTDEIPLTNIVTLLSMGAPEIAFESPNFLGKIYLKLADFFKPSYWLHTSCFECLSSQTNLSKSINNMKKKFPNSISKDSKLNKRNKELFMKIGVLQELNLKRVGDYLLTKGINISNLSCKSV